MPDNKTPSYAITILLASMPTGWVGLHHYYVGQKKRAILYALFVWTLVPIALSILESALLLYRGQDWFIEKHGDDEDIKNYHIKKIMEEHPEVLRDDVLMDDLIEQKTNDEDMKEKNPSNTSNNAEDTKDDTEEFDRSKGNTQPDYSNYYGDWS